MDGPDLYPYPEPPELPELSVVGEIRAGGNYLIRVPAKLSAEQADEIQRRLAARFPGSTFALVTPGIDLVEDWRSELLAALDAVSARSDGLWFKASTEAGRVSMAGARHAARMLRQELSRTTPERADALPEQPASPAPVERMSTSAPDGGAGGPVEPPYRLHADPDPAPPSPPEPMCSAWHPRLHLRCDLDLGHKAIVRHHAEAQDFEVFW